jgi:hypothetical protein
VKSQTRSGCPTLVKPLRHVSPLLRIGWPGKFWRRDTKVLDLSDLVARQVPP